MKTSTTFEWLSKAIEQATKSAKFCVAGRLPAIDPGIEVEGLEAIKLPLKQTKAKELAAHCQVAPYGQGTQTLVNKKVREVPIPWCSRRPPTRSTGLSISTRRTSAF